MRQLYFHDNYTDIWIILPDILNRWVERLEYQAKYQKVNTLEPLLTGFSKIATLKHNTEPI